MKPKISVIIPVYNTEAYIEKCLQSVIKQTFKEIEIIVIIDGSPDNSLSICQNIKDSRITLHIQENKGLGASRNKGVYLAKSDFVFFLDSDDYIEPNTLEKLYNKVLQENADLVISKWKKVTEEGETIKKRNDFELLQNINSQPKIPIIFSGNLSMIICGNLIKKELLTDNLLLFPNVLHEDLYVTPKLFYYATKVSLVNDTLYNWLDRGESILNSFNKKHILGIGGIFTDWSNFIQSLDLYDKYKDVLGKILKKYLRRYEIKISYMDTSKTKEALMTYLNSLQLKLFYEFDNKEYYIFEKERYTAKDDFYREGRNWPLVVDCNKYQVALRDKYQIKDISKLNMDFSIQYNELLQTLTTFAQMDATFAIYGCGTIGKLMANELTSKAKFIIDKNPSIKFYNNIKVVSPKDFNQTQVDYVIISVLGREKEIQDFLISDLTLTPSQILTIKFQR